MKFYLRTINTGRFKTSFFGKKNFHHELVSIGVFCENGNCYYAISRDFDRGKYKGAIGGPEQILTDGRWKTNDHIAEDIRLFVSYNAGNSEVELYGMDCAVDFTLLTGIYGGKDSGQYPSCLPAHILDMRQIISEMLRELPEAHFRESDKYSIIPAEGQLTLVDRHDVFESQDDYPDVDEYNGSALTQAMYISHLHKYVRDFKKSLTVTKPE
jgi:hypothetical protein